MQVSICDFEDSFTYNIYSELLDLGLECEVIAMSKIKDHLQRKINQKEKQVVILGPGPGHPCEYEFLKETVLNLLQNPNILTMGICLGHQLLWYFQGHEVSRALQPLHGQRVCYKLTDYWKVLLGDQIQVQRYNSLAVKMDLVTKKNYQQNGWHLFLEDGECIMSKHENILSYQYHPESVGTSCPQQFFEPVRRFLL